MFVIFETTATGSGGFPSLFMHLFSCSGLFTWAANQSAFLYWWVTTVVESAEKPLTRIEQLTLHWPETPTVSDSPDNSDCRLLARCEGAEATSSRIQSMPLVSYIPNMKNTWINSGAAWPVTQIIVTFPLPSCRCWLHQHLPQLESDSLSHGGRKWGRRGACQESHRPPSEAVCLIRGAQGCQQTHYGSTVS